VTSYRDGEFARAEFSGGILQREEKGAAREKNGTLVEFQPDPEMFPEYSFSRDFVRKRLKRYAYLNAGLKLHLDGEIFYSENGLLDLLEAETSGTQLYEPIHHRDKSIEFAFVHTDNYGESYFSFVNGTFSGIDALSVRMKAASGLGGMVRLIGAALGVSPHANTADLIVRIKNALTKDMVLILDEVHLLANTYQRSSFFKCMEVIRELHDKKKLHNSYLAKSLRTLL
jgi:hypothetical protein